MPSTIYVDNLPDKDSKCQGSRLDPRAPVFTPSVKFHNLTLNPTAPTFTPGAIHYLRRASIYGEIWLAHSGRALQLSKQRAHARHSLPTSWSANFWNCLIKFKKSLSAHGANGSPSRLQRSSASDNTPPNDVSRLK